MHSSSSLPGLLLSILAALALGCGAGSKPSSPSKEETVWTPRFLFSLDRFASGKPFRGEETIDLDARSVSQIRGALQLIESILEDDDARRPLIWTTRITYNENAGRSDVAARWVPEEKRIELFPGFLKGPLQLVVTLAHELTHAAEVRARRDNLRDMLVDEARAYHAGEDFAKRLSRFIMTMDGLDERKRSYFLLVMEYYAQESEAFHSMEETRLRVGDLGARIALMHDSFQQANMQSDVVDFLARCEAGLTAFARADRVLTLEDTRSVDGVLQALFSFFANSTALQTDRPGDAEALTLVLREQVGRTVTKFRRLQHLQERLAAYPRAGSH